jgi:hypothetical protein
LVYEDFITTLGTLHVDREMDDFPGCTVASDNKQLMLLVADHLVAIGYNKVTINAEAAPASEPASVSSSATTCPYSHYEHDHGATISFDLDLFNPGDLFNVLEKISGFKILKKEGLHSSFGPLESVSEYFTTKGDFTLSSTWEGMDTGHTLSSSNKELIRLIIETLRYSSAFSEIVSKSIQENNQVEQEEIPSPSVENNDDAGTFNLQPAEIETQQPKSKSEDGCGGTLITLFFLFLTFYLFAQAVNFYSKLSINLDQAKMHRGKVIHSSISTKGGIRKSTGFNLEIEGLDHRFRFFNGEFSTLKEKIRPGTEVTIYYEPGSWTIYQIEQNGNVLFDKKIVEGNQWPGIIMSLVFALFTGWITWFFIKRK